MEGGDERGHGLLICFSCLGNGNISALPAPGSPALSAHQRLSHQPCHSSRFVRHASMLCRCPLPSYLSARAYEDDTALRKGLVISTLLFFIISFNSPSALAAAFLSLRPELSEGVRRKGFNSRFMTPSRFPLAGPDVGPNAISGTACVIGGRSISAL